MSFLRSEKNLKKCRCGGFWCYLDPLETRVNIYYLRICELCGLKQYAVGEHLTPTDLRKSSEWHFIGLDETKRLIADAQEWPKVKDEEHRKAQERKLEQDQKYKEKKEREFQETTAILNGHRNYSFQDFKARMSTFGKNLSSQERTT